jgi:hypothetical protein
MATQDLILEVSGLVNSPNPFSNATPQGSFLQADNCVINDAGILESRRGNTVLSALASSTRVTSFAGSFFALSGTNLQYFNGTTWSTRGTASPPDSSTPVRFNQAAKGLFYTSAAGVFKIPNTGTGAALAGIPRPGPPTAIVPFNTGANWMPYNTAVSYRVVFSTRDANSNVLIGPPCGRIVFANLDPSDPNPRTPRLSIPVVAGSSGLTVRIYRSALSATAATAPADEVFLTGSHTISLGEVLAGTFEFVDNTPPSSLGAALYTNAGQEGAVQENDAPPAARDICNFRGTTIYANTWDRQRLTNTHNWYLVGTQNSPVTIPIGGVFTLSDGTNTETYTAATSENVAAKQFQVFATSNAGLMNNLLQASDAELTVRSLAKCINYPFGKTVVTIKADVLSSGTLVSQEATILSLETLAPTLTTVTASPTAPVNANNITNQSLASGVVTVTQTAHGYSLGQQIDILTPAGASFPAGTYVVTSVPGANSWTYSGTTGTASSSTVVQSRLNLSAVWRSTQTVTNLADVTTDGAVTPAGLSYSKFQQPEAVPLENSDTVGNPVSPILRVVALRDSVLILKSEGIFRLTGNTPSDFSIDPVDLTTILTWPESVATMDDNCFLVSNRGPVIVSESTGVTPLGIPIDEVFQNAQTLYSNAPVLAWGMSYPTERKFIVWVPAANSGTPGFAYVYSTKSNAWTRWLVPANHGIVDPVTGKLTLVDGTNVLIERKDLAATDYQDPAGAVITCPVQWVPAAGGNPGLTKQFVETSLNFRLLQAPSVSVNYSSDVDPSTEAQTRLKGPNTANVTVRTLVPRNKARGTMLNVGFTHATAQCNFQLQSSSLIYRQVSSRTPNGGG